MSRKSSQTVGREHLIRLENWVEKTPLAKIPLNQSGRSSKLTICRELGISPSSLGSNIRIKKVFEKLDIKLSGATHTQKENVTCENNTTLASSELIALLDELEETHAKLARLRHLSNTGQWIPEE